MIQELLQLNYDQAAYFYDTLELDVELNKKMMQGVFSALAKNSAKKVWDAACGTGAQSIPLYEQGFQVIASDINETMVSIAKEKLGLDFQQGDMRTFNPGKVDAVIAMMNPFGHLTKQGVRDSLKNFHSHLNEGGLIIGDVDNRAFLEKVLTDEPFISAVRFIEKEKYVRRTRAQKMTDGIYEIHDQWLKGEFVTFDDLWDLQTWYLFELEEVLKSSGYKEVQWFRRNFKPISQEDLLKSDSLLFVAKKA